MMARLLPWFSQLLAVVFLSLAFVGGAVASGPVAPVNTENGLAVKGYDPVAYFTAGKPVPGSAQFSAIYQGATYHFASAENRDVFVATPEKYAPQFGGYCAFAVSRNTTADIDPDRWAIVEGKLYLNNGLIAQTLWNLDKPENISRANKNWPEIAKAAEPKS
jgi:YHS domain-containing protein